MSYELTKNLVNPMITQINAATSTTSNPLGKIQDLGQGMLDVGTGTTVAIWSGIGGADVAIGLAGSEIAGTGTDTVPDSLFITALGAFITAIAAPFFMFGVLCAYIIPMLPYTVMVLAIIGYVAAVAVAMVGAPLWIAAHAVPTGEGFVSDRSKAGYSLLLSLFAKPPLIVFGFFLALAMFSAGVWLINQTFFTALAVVLGSIIPSGALALAGRALALAGVELAPLLFVPLIVYILGMIAMLFIFVSLYLTVAKWSFGLINLVPDHALSWIGLQDISMSEERMADEALIGQAYMAHRASSGAVSSTVSSTSSPTRKKAEQQVKQQSEQKAAQAARDKDQADIASSLRSMSSGSSSEGGGGTGAKGGRDS